ncbi:hypothetical protein ACSBR1_015892 [Camellia fascicularis]
MGLLAAYLVLYLEIPPEKAAERGDYGGEKYEHLDVSKKKVARSYQMLCDASWKFQKKQYEKHHNTADGRIRIWPGIRKIMNSTDHLLTETRGIVKELKTGIHTAYDMWCSLQL